MIIPLGITRFFQLVFSVVVLALSITAIKWQQFGSAPAASGYAAFTGAWGLLTSLLGIAAIFVAALAGVIMAGADLLAFILLLAGGITWAVKLRGIDCGAWNDSNSYSNPVLYDLVNEGSYIEGDTIWTPRTRDNWSVFGSHCTTGRANTAFLFLAAVASLVAAILVLLAHRRGASRSSAV